ncbi:MAG: hypothetical protein AABM66_02630 [Actinomycetota bacterium]
MPQQRIWRARVEALIGLAAPALDLVLNVGDRVSRTLAPGDNDYYPIRAPAEAFELGPVPRADQQRPRSEPVD